MSLQLLKPKLHIGYDCACGDQVCSLNGCRVESLARSMVSTLMRQSGALIGAEERTRVINLLWKTYAPMAEQVVRHFQRNAKITPRKQAQQ
jgi:predicted component of type VI protein secretion system